VGFVADLVVGRLVLPPIMPPPVMPPGSCCATALLVNRNSVADKQTMRGKAMGMGFLLCFTGMSAQWRRLAL
jgi:hypothetical protein